MFITPAYAQAAGGMGSTDMLIQFAPLVFVFIIMSMLLFRPQQKRAAEHKKMIGNVRRGDTIVTTGGLVGRVTKVVDDNEVEIEIADGVRVRIVRAMISDVRAKGEPVSHRDAQGGQVRPATRVAAATATSGGAPAVGAKAPRGRRSGQLATRRRNSCCAIPGPRSSAFC